MFRFLFSRLIPQTKQQKQDLQSYPSSELSASLEVNTQYIQSVLASPSDLLIRKITVGAGNHACATIGIDGLVDKDLVNQNVLKPMQIYNWDFLNNLQTPAGGIQLLNQLIDEVLPINGIRRTNQMDVIILAVLSGETALLVDGTPEALIIGSQGWEARAVQEPQTEALIRGPREGFTENLRTNMALVRRRLKDPKLRFTCLNVGRRSQTQTAIAYIEGIVNPELIQEVMRRINTIDVDDAIGSGFIEQWISDSFLSPFPQILSTERPDKIAAALIQGKVGILVD
ncbi:MAG: spore germination protein, partial [Paenibacillus sp.]|nr:spore germination protein [Paenibacillus sp.]